MKFRSLFFKNIFIVSYIGVDGRTLFCLGFALWLYLEDDWKFACRGAELWLFEVKVRRGIMLFWLWQPIGFEGDSPVWSVCKCACGRQPIGNTQEAANRNINQTLHEWVVSSMISRHGKPTGILYFKEKENTWEKYRLKRYCDEKFKG